AFDPFNVASSSGSSYLRVTQGGNVGIGTSTPGQTLTVAGTLQITGGSPGLGKLLTSDANGIASWTATSTLGLQPAGNYVTNTYASSTFPSFTYASSTFVNYGYGSSTYATIASYPTYTYASAT